MRMIFRLLMLMLMLGGWVLAAASLHVIRTPSTIALVPRSRLCASLSAIAETYVDTRTWTMVDVSNHPNLVKRVIEVGKADLLKEVADPRSGLSIEAQLADAVQNGASMAQRSPIVRAAKRTARSMLRAQSHQID